MQRKFWRGDTRNEIGERRRDLLIELEGNLSLEEGQCYLITVKNMGERQVKAVFTKTEIPLPRGPASSSSSQQASHQAEAVSDSAFNMAGDILYGLGASRTPGAQGWHSLPESMKQFFEARGGLKMTQFYTQLPSASDPELDNLSVSELQARTATKFSELDATERR